MGFEDGAACPDPAGCTRWVGSAASFNDGSLPPFTAAATQCDDEPGNAPAALMYVYGAEILPSSTYVLETTRDGANFTSRGTVVTGLFGDVLGPFGTVNFQDVQGIIQKFKGVGGAPSKVYARLYGNVATPSTPVNFHDVSEAVAGFQIKPYPFSGPCPCPSLVQCGAGNCQSPGIGCNGGVCNPMNGKCEDECGRCAP